MRTKIVVAIAALSVGFAGIAISQESPIVQRQGLMKQNGAAMGAASKMAKGEMAYNEAEAAGAMKTIADNMAEFVKLFPEDSMEGGDPPTRAKASIWEDMAGFQAEADAAIAAAKAAEAAAAQGQEAYAAALGAVGGACGDCHEKYRGPKPN